MEACYYAVGFTLVFLCNSLIMYTLAWYFTERAPLPIRRKPFNCRECLTFWFTLLPGLGIAYGLVHISPYNGSAIVTALLVLIAILFAFLNFLYTKSQIQIYE